MHWDYLKRLTNFRRQLSKRHVTLIIIFARTRKSRKIHQKPFKCDFFVITLTSSGHSNKARMHFSAQKPIFNILNVNFTLSAFYELLKSTDTLSTFFTLKNVWNAFWQCFSLFELRSCRLRPLSDVKHYNYMLICVYCTVWKHTRLK